MMKEEEAEIENERALKHISNTDSRVFRNTLHTYDSSI